MSSYWYCPNCQEELPGCRVTYAELCDTCGARVLSIDEGISQERIAEIIAAEKDGRCVVLPCKAGVDVYAVINKKVHDCVCVGWKWNGGNIYMLCMDRATGKEFSFFDFHFTGALSGLQTVFLSRAQAEAAKGAG
jgi:hypothetical protein